MCAVVDIKQENKKLMLQYVYLKDSYIIKIHVHIIYYIIIKTGPILYIDIVKVSGLTL